MAGGLRWTEEQLAAYQQRCRKYGSLIIPNEDLREIEAMGHKPDDEPEFTLQRKCEALCTERGYPFFHDRSRGKNKAGFPDLVIALPGARTAWCELKKPKTGRLSPEQKRWRLMLMHLGHEWYEVRSFRQFCRIVADAKSNP